MSKIKGCWGEEFNVGDIVMYASGPSARGDKEAVVGFTKSGNIRTVNVGSLIQDSRARPYAQESLRYVCINGIIKKELLEEYRAQIARKYGDEFDDLGKHKDKPLSKLGCRVMTFLDPTTNLMHIVRTLEVKKSGFYGHHPEQDKYFKKIRTQAQERNPLVHLRAKYMAKANVAVYSPADDLDTHITGASDPHLYQQINISKRSYARRASNMPQYVVNKHISTYYMSDYSPSSKQRPSKSMSIRFAQGMEEYLVDSEVHDEYDIDTWVIPEAEYKRLYDQNRWF